MISILASSNFQWVLLSTILLGMASGMVGTMSYLRKQGLMSDAISHAALPGVMIAFLLTGEKDLFILITGAAISGLIGAGLIQIINDTTRIKEDAAMGIILSVFFGGGIMLLTIANRVGGGRQSGLDSFIFGQAASMVQRDAFIMGLLAIGVIALIGLLYKEWKVVLFDPNHASMIGIPVKIYQSLYTFLLVFVIVIGIQAVGVILMAALLIIPAVSAHYWTHSLFVMFILSAAIGGFSGGFGTYVSTFGNSLPTGPFIVVTSATIFLISLVFGSKKGLLDTYKQTSLIKMKDKTNGLRGDSK